MNFFLSFVVVHWLPSAASVFLFGPVTLLRTATGFMSYMVLLVRASFS